MSLGALGSEKARGASLWNGRAGDGGEHVLGRGSELKTLSLQCIIGDFSDFKEIGSRSRPLSRDRGIRRLSGVTRWAGATPKPGHVEPSWDI